MNEPTDFSKVPDLLVHEVRTKPIDVQQVIYALQRQMHALAAHANKLADQRDYSAELPYEDAQRLREAIELLQQQQPTDGAEVLLATMREIEQNPAVRLELLVWHIVPGPGLPDADATALCQLDDDDEDCWPGYYDGERWMSAEGFPFASRVIAWSQPRGVKP